MLVSGSGTNLQALIDAGIPIAAVASNVAGAPALERAAAVGVPTARVRARRLPRPRRARHRDGRLARRRTASTSSSVRATCTCCDRRSSSRFPARVVNVHPALLPAFPGAHAVEDALAAGVTETGATVHLVDEGVDTGAVLRQEAVRRAPRRHARDAARADQGGRASPAARGRPGADRRMRRALLSVYDKTGVVGVRAGAPPARASSSSRAAARRRLLADEGIPVIPLEDADGLRRDARPPRRHAAPGRARRHPRAPRRRRRTSPTSPPTGSSRSTSSASTSTRSSRPSAGSTSSGTRRSSRSTSAGRRCCARRPRITRT